jgi:hypothetical protein
VAGCRTVPGYRRLALRLTSLRTRSRPGTKADLMLTAASNCQGSFQNTGPRDRARACEDLAERAEVSAGQTTGRTNAAGHIQGLTISVSRRIIAAVEGRWHRLVMITCSRLRRDRGARPFLTFRP